jgi:glycosyltransferase involved in cell wall biosynthesis
VQLGSHVGEDAALIYVWMQPYASAAAGASLSRALGKPWVADLGDPWALDEMMVYPTALHRGMARRNMRALLSSAAAIVMSTPEATTRLQREFPEFADRPVFTIPNGFAASDFESPLPPRDRSSFRVVHTGHLHTELGRDHRRRLAVRHTLGGSVGGLDILTRSHVYLIKAIDDLLERHPALANTLELHIAGVLTEADLEVAAHCSVARLHGYVTHAESIELMRTADLLFLPMQDLPPGVRATIVPGKTYEYLASERPILAAVPDGDARDILTEAGNTIIVRPHDVEGMTDALWSELERWRQGVEAPRPAADVVSRFEYRKLTAQLAGVFDTVLDTNQGPL